MDTWVYKLDGVNYINLTNKCTCACTFCLRDHMDGVGGYGLWLEKEPTAEQVITILAGDQTDIVFCGYGEPTEKLEELLSIAHFVKGYGGRVRLDTNGHGSAINGRDIVPALAPLTDEISISLNAPTAARYAELTRCRFPNGFSHMLDFAKKCVQCGIGTTLSVVDVLSDEEIEACRAIAEGLGARLRVRHCV